MKEKTIWMKVINFLGELLREASSPTEVKEIENLLNAIIPKEKKEKTERRKSNVIKKNAIKKKDSRLEFTEREKILFLTILSLNKTERKSLWEIGREIRNSSGVPIGTIYSAFENGLEKIQKIYQLKKFPPDELGMALKKLDNFEEVLNILRKKIIYRGKKFRKFFRNQDRLERAEAEQIKQRIN